MDAWKKTVGTIPALAAATLALCAAFAAVGADRRSRDAEARATLSERRASETEARLNTLEGRQRATSLDVNQLSHLLLSAVAGRDPDAASPPGDPPAATPETTGK